MDEFDDIFRGKTTDAFKYKSQLLNTESSIADNLDIVDDGAGARSVLALCPSSTSSNIMHLMDRWYYLQENECWFIHSSNGLKSQIIYIYTKNDAMTDNIYQQK